MTELLSYKPKTPIKKLGLGVFDGVHKGHQQIISQCDYVLSFRPHPDIILNKNSTLEYLSTEDERQVLIPKLIYLNFNNKIAKMSAHQFLETIILDLAPQHIVVGYDFKFGYKQEGDYTVLEEWAKTQQITTKKIEPFLDSKDHPIKSSRIRDLLKEDPNAAIDLLGHPYLIQGKVIHGDNRGKELGFPTANLDIPTRKCLPSPGVYKGFVKHKNTQHKAAIYIGQKPTFDRYEMTVEVHILDFHEQLYNESLNVFIQEKIRNDIKFKSKEELISQIEQDVQGIRGT